MRPETVGLPVNGHRRTPGLRREEVAQLAGVGLSWYTWLEQGRDITPSPSVLDALARVFDLEVPERAHLPSRTAHGRPGLERLRHHGVRHPHACARRRAEPVVVDVHRLRELWRRHEVLDAQVATKVIEHSRLGRLEVHHLQSIPTSHPDLRLTQFVPADDATRAALAAACT